MGEKGYDRVTAVDRAAEIFESIARELADPGRVWRLDYDHEEEESAGTQDNLSRIAEGLNALADRIHEARKTVVAGMTSESREYLIAVEELLDVVSALRTRAAAAVTHRDRPKGRVREIISRLLDQSQAFDFWKFAAELRADALLLQANSAVVSNEPIEPVSGPGPRLQFIWGGKAVPFANAPLRYQLCVSLWDPSRKQPHDERQEGDVLSELYGDKSSGKPEAKLKDLVKETNAAFEVAGLPLRIVRAAAKVWIEVRTDR